MKKRFIIFLPVGILFLSLTVIFRWASQSTFAEELCSLQHSAHKTFPADSSIIVISYNIGYLSGMTNNRAVKPEASLFQKNLEQLKEKLTEVKPNLICFQEIDYGSNRSYRMNQHDSLTANSPCSLKAINWDKRFVPFPYWPPSVWFGQVLSGQSIISDWEISQCTREVLPKVESTPFYYSAFYLDRLLVSAKIHHPVRDFILMNLHAEAFDTITRNKQLALVYQRFKQEAREHAVILAGDFNATPESGEPGMALFLTDSTIGCAAQPHDGKPASFPSSAPQERIDYIFYSKKDFVENEAWIAEEFGSISDHLPIIARLTFR